MDGTSITAIIAILGSCVGALIWIIKRLFEKVTPALESLGAAVQRNTDATKSADEYLRQRNGRDIEFHTKIMEELRDIRIKSTLQSNASLKQMERLGDATVDKIGEIAENTPPAIIGQHVEKQIIHKDS